MAQSDARPTGDQEVVDSIPDRSWRFIMNYFLTAILSLPLIQEGQLLGSGKECAQVLVNRLKD